MALTLWQPWNRASRVVAKVEWHSASGAENGYRTARRLRKTAIAGRNGLAKPLSGKKIVQHRPNHQDLEPKWEIPGAIDELGGYTKERNQNYEHLEKTVWQQ